MIDKALATIRKDIYWEIVFPMFVFSFFYPFGSGPLKSVLYCLIIIPGFVLISKKEIARLLSFPPFLLFLILCLYAILRSVNLDWLNKTVVSSLLIIGLIFGAVRLPQPSVDVVMKGSLLFILALISYILFNAAFFYSQNEWAFLSRLPPMLGEIKSVIFAADLLVAGVITCNWSCLKTNRYWLLVFMNILVLLVALVLLQSRSAIAVWIVSVSVLVATQVRGFRKVLKATGVLVGIAAVLVWGISSMGIFSQLLQRGDSYRIEIWSGQLDKLYQCGVIVGCGWGNSLEFIAKDGMYISHMHSMYMQHLNWGGLIGLALLLVSVGLPLVRGIRSSHYASWILLAGCVALMFDGKTLLSMPNERWLLINLPLALLIAGLFDQSKVRRY